MVAQLAWPGHLVTDGLDVYVTAYCLDGGEVARIPTDGGALAVMATQSGPWGLALDDEWVYWSNQTSDDTGHVTNGGTIDRIAKAGGPVQTVVSSPEPSEIVVDDTNVYWNDTYYGANSIWTAPKAGTGSPTLLIKLDGQLSGGLALDATHVYWVELDNIPYGTLYRIPKSGGTAEAVASGPFAYQFAASDDGGIYAGMNGFGPDSSTGGVLRYDTATGNTRIYGRRTTSPVGVAVDATHVYWTDDRDGILAAPFDGGATVQVASNVVKAFPMGIAVANGVVYWAASSEGVVRSVPVPSGP